MQKVICSNCGKEFFKKRCQVYKRNFCCIDCRQKYRVGKHNANTGKRNGQWKGDLVGYTALHDYIKYHLPKPELCQCCGKVEPRDLANKGKYDRNLNNWEWLCRRCHMTKDGRLARMIERNKSKNKKKGEVKDEM